jgi:hypothetical protein
VNLLLGEALLLRESGERDLRIGTLGGYAGLLGPGRGALALSLDAAGAEIFCLTGTCAFQPPSGDPSVLFAGQRLRPGGAPQLFDATVYDGWSRLCGGCLATP